MFFIERIFAWEQREVPPAVEGGGALDGEVFLSGGWGGEQLIRLHGGGFNVLHQQVVRVIGEQILSVRIEYEGAGLEVLGAGLEVGGEARGLHAKDRRSAEAFRIFGERIDEGKRLGDAVVGGKRFVAPDGGHSAVEHVVGRIVRALGDGVVFFKVGACPVHAGDGEYRIRVRQDEEEIILRAVEQIDIGNIAFEVHIGGVAAFVVGEASRQVGLIAVSALEQLDCVVE